MGQPLLLLLPIFPPEPGGLKSVKDLSRPIAAHCSLLRGRKQILYFLERPPLLFWRVQDPEVTILVSCPGCQIGIQNWAVGGLLGGRYKCFTSLSLAV